MPLLKCLPATSATKMNAKGITTHISLPGHSIYLSNLLFSKGLNYIGFMKLLSLFY